MELKEGEVRIFYRVEDKIADELDRRVEKALRDMGYRRWASGYEVKTGIRDLAFERTKDE